MLEGKIDVGCGGGGGGGGGKGLMVEDHPQGEQSIHRNDCQPVEGVSVYATSVMLRTSVTGHFTATSTAVTYSGCTRRTTRHSTFLPPP
ncbi:hypothetical protein TcWFU_006394 [Taenia crassiceps]|uniref:Uncharacterized protein n=1 Tax=Taenia crassiceps TaxID=6207 RepID=A0ABR4PYR0_9CEST